MRVIVGSKYGAEWIASKFPGAVIEKLAHDINAPRRAGRPKNEAPSKALSGAERQRALRARRKAEGRA